MKFKPRQTDSRAYVKLKDGESITGIFVGEPFTYRQHWSEGKAQPCKGEGCDSCASGSKGSFRFRINLIVKEGENYIAKILEQGARFYDAITSLEESGYALEDHLMKISRRGSTMNDTTYSVLPVPNSNSAHLKEIVTQAKLNDLGFVEEDIPF